MKKIATLVIASTLLTSGCASRYGEQITNVKHYGQCYAPISELRAAEAKSDNTVIGGAVGGALLGALAGAAIDSKNPGRGALIGAAAGAAVGAGAGYAVAKHREIEEDKARYASYINEMDADLQNATGVQLAANNARKCYESQFKKAVADYKSKRISRAEFDEKFAEIRNGLTEATTILGVALTNLQERENTYQEALNYEAEQAGRKPRAPSTRVSMKQTPPATLDGFAIKGQQLSQQRVSLQQEKDEMNTTLARLDKEVSDLMGTGA